MNHFPGMLKLEFIVKSYIIPLNSDQECYLLRTSSIKSFRNVVLIIYINNSMCRFVIDTWSKLEHVQLCSFVSLDLVMICLVPY